MPKRRLPMKVSRVQEMRNLDQTAIKNYGISDDLLMENAGLASFHALAGEFDIPDNRFLIICGIGNNGGDGLVVARKIHSMGGLVKLLILGRPDNFKGAAKHNYAIVSKLGLDIGSLDRLEILQDALLCSDIIVDALFGTGLSRKVEGLYAGVIDAVNQASLPVVSIDIPSGIHGDTGEVMGTAVSADMTVTFGLPKLGNILYPGFEHCGKLFVTHISFPPQLTTDEQITFSLNRPPVLPSRRKDSHKGSFGDTLFISGAASYLGAPYFAALSFMKAGGGYARLAAPSSITAFIAAKGSEIVFAPMEETEAGTLSKGCRREILSLADIVDFAVIGPGLSLHEETQELCRQLIVDIPKPLLIDGDGLSAVAQNPALLEQREAPTILTPHLGEMARLTGLAVADIIRNKADIIQEFSARWKAALVLKGAHSLVGLPDGRGYINLSGNNGMATAGSGDVLTGTIAAMYGLGLKTDDAVRTGVFLHGFAGDLAAAAKGEDGITAQDILDALPEALRHFRQNYESLMANEYESVYLI
jgi:hydroxyethylthiazole kinase-like uncharacterized protein yjeF